VSSWLDLKFLGSVYLTLFVIMDPPGIIPVFLALTARRGKKAMARAAAQAALTAFGVITLFAVFGERILSFLGITLPALQASGGLLLLIISLELLTGNTSEPSTTSTSRWCRWAHRCSPDPARSSRRFSSCARLTTSRSSPRSSWASSRFT